MRLHHNKKANSYTFAMTEDELLSIGISIQDYKSPYEEGFQEIIGVLTEFFLSTLSKYEGASCLEHVEKVIVQFHNGIFLYHIQSEDPEKDSRIGPLIRENIDLEEEIFEYATDLHCDLPGEQSFPSEYQFLFDDLTNIIHFCKALPSIVLKSLSGSSLVKTCDGYVLNISLNAPDFILETLHLDVIAEEWDGIYIEKIYEDIEEFQLANAVMELRKL